MRIAGFGDRAARVFGAAGVLGRDQADEGHHARRAVGKRRGSPSSAAMVSAVRSSMPRKQRRRATRGAQRLEVRQARRSASTARSRATRFVDGAQIGGDASARAPAAATSARAARRRARFDHAFLVPVKRRPCRSRNFERRCRARSRSARMSSRQRSRSRAASSCSVGMWIGGQRAGAIQHRELAGVAPVRLDPIARAAGNQRRRDHVAGIPSRVSARCSSKPHGPAS